MTDPERGPYWPQWAAGGSGRRPVSATKYRLVTRSDFDGLVCAVLLKKLNLLEDILFVHPKDVTDGKVDISKNDITTNLPYNPKCHLAFDHHDSEALRFGGNVPDNFILDASADSAARVVYRHFGGRAKFPDISGAMMTAGKVKSMPSEKYQPVRSAGVAPLL